MFPLVPVTKGIFTSRLWFVVIVATCAILARTSCQLHRNVLGKPQQKNNPLRQPVTKSRQKRQINLNNTVQDNHKYYNSQFYQDGQHLWKDLRNKAGSVRDDHLSSGDRAIKAVQLSFEFPYYGHFVTNATLTTGGFINLGESKSRQVAEFQYVAPLMAHFNPSVNSTSTVHHFTDGNEFIVQWSNVLLHENPEVGSFTFQCMLNKTGEIVFSYQKIPIPVTNISRAVHPVDIGISDAYYVDKLRHYYGIWQLFRTFYTYDAVHINQSWPVDNAAVVFHPKPSCITARTCEECIDRRQHTEFNCIWCGKLKRCSDGFDRHRAEWLSSGCSSSGIFQIAKCAIQEAQIESDGSEATPGLAPWIIAVICAGGVLLFASVAWLVYAFTHPNSRSGLWLQHGPTSCCRGNQENYEDSLPTNSSVFNKVLT